MGTEQDWRFVGSSQSLQSVLDTDVYKRQRYGIDGSPSLVAVSLGLRYDIEWQLTHMRLMLPLLLYIFDEMCIRDSDTDCKMVMEAALPLYKNLYTMHKYKGESLTTRCV